MPRENPRLAEKPPQPERKLVEFFREVLGIDYFFDTQWEILKAFEDPTKSEIVLNCGRRSAKTTIAAGLAIYDAVCRDFLDAYVPRKEPRYIAVVSTAEDDAAEVLGIMSGLIQANPALRAMVVRENRERIWFSNGACIRSLPCSARRIRGKGYSCVIMDEFGHYEDVDGADTAGDRVMTAATPALAQYLGLGWLIVLSTPLTENSAFGRTVHQFSQTPHPDQLYFHRTTAQMRPDLVASGYLEKERLKNPEAYSLEFDAQFAQGARRYYDPPKVRAAQRGTSIRPPLAGIRYIAALDPAFDQDHFAMGIAHQDPGDGHTVVDLVRTWLRGGYERTLDEVAILHNEYRVQDMTTDQHSVTAILEGLAKRNIPSRRVDWTAPLKMSAHARTKLAMDYGTLELPSDPAIADEFISIEATPMASGMTRIAAPGRLHDDRVTVIVSLVNTLTMPNEVAVIFAGDRESRKAGYWKDRDSDGDPTWPVVGQDILSAH